MGTVATNSRIKAKDAAAALGVSTSWLYTLANQGDIRPTTNSGSRGTGKRLYFDPLEIDAYARGGAPAAKAYRLSLESNGAPKRGRRAKV